MFNPLLDSLASLSDTEIDNKISDLNKKYFQTQNPQVQHQMAVLIEEFQLEAQARRARAFGQQNQNNGDESLDSLINIS